MTTTPLKPVPAADSPDRSAHRVTDFGTLRIAYDDRVLEPRRWTTLQSDWAAELAVAAPAGPILELCCGAGQIGLLAAEQSGRELIAVDADPIACSWTTRNARAAGLANRVSVRASRLESACRPHEQFGLIIADPPWVPRSEVTRFPEDPVLAIDGGDDGLDVARACLQVIETHLHPQGSALLQVGPGSQIDALAAELPPSLRISDRREVAGRGLVALVSPITQDTGNWPIDRSSAPWR